MKRILHIWRYLTSPMYRAYVDLQMTQSALDAHINMMKDQIALSKIPPVIADIMHREGISEEYATELYRVRGF